AEQLRQEIYRLEKEREKYTKDANEATEKYYEALEQVKAKSLEGVELQKKIEELNEKLFIQQGLFHKVRSDRNKYSKDLVEAQEEIANLRQKFKIMDQQIQQLKEEIDQQEQCMYFFL